MGEKIEDSLGHLKMGEKKGKKKKINSRHCFATE